MLWVKDVHHLNGLVIKMLNWSAQIVRFHFLLKAMLFSFELVSCIPRSCLPRIFFNVPKRLYSMETHAHLELIMTKYHYSHLNIVMNSSLASVLYSAKRSKS